MMKLIPSKANIWARCPASTKLPKSEQLDNERRVEGIDRHDRMEKALKGLGNYEESQDLIDYLAEQYENPYDQFVELKMRRTFTEGSSRADIIADDGHLVTVIDSKFGFVEVPAIENFQLLCYAVDYHNHIGKKARDFKLVIYQPTPNGYPTFKEWFISNNEFPDWFRELLTASTRAKESDAQRTGEHCTYCPCKLNCGSYLQKPFGVLEVENRNPTPGSTYGLSIEAISATYEEVSQKVKVLKQLEKAFEEQLILTLRAGKPAGDWSLKRSKGKSFWKADVEQLKTFQRFSGVKLLEEKPIKITEAKKNKDFKEEIASFMGVSSGSETLVKINKSEQSKEIFK